MAPHLKSLELHGYKTFASRVEFEFIGSKTAIVGPNGSGKSNIADSIRWVLGEQSYSLLRGRKTEDMIFAGSELKPRASMASASIVFDNEDNWLPIDYSEVSITRRAYRDGQNEYLINGQKVRLKEILEMLSQSGLAERTYTIIGQGLVDAALSLRPDERRRFFEEAAGIGLYRRRREEAINRLADTHRNLERVADILSEIEPRLRSLEKQAQRVREYERIKSELKLMLRDWYGYHWHRAQQEFSHGQEVYRKQEERLGESRKRLMVIEGVLKTDCDQIQDLREKLNKWHSQSSDLHQQRELVGRELAVLDERHRAQINQQQMLQSDQTRLTAESKLYVEKYETIQIERNQIDVEKQEAEHQLEQVRQHLNEQHNERKERELALHERRNVLTNYETKLIQLNAHKEELDRRSSSYQESLEVHIGLIEREEGKIRELHAELTTLTKNHEQAQKECEKVEAAEKSLRKELEKLEFDIRIVQQNRSQTEVESSSKSAMLEVLKQAESSMTGMNQGASFLLKKSLEGKIKGNFKAFSGEIEVPAEYETAIAAVLGDYLDSVILGHNTDPENAITILENGENGRTILLPVDWMHATNLIDVEIIEQAIAGLGKTNYLGRALDLIKVPQGSQPIIDLLFNQAIIVRDRTAARKAAQKLPSSARAITLKGEVFWGNGVVVAGKDGREGIISRPRQIRDLISGIDDNKKTMDKYDHQLVLLDIEKQSFSDRLIKLDEALNQEKTNSNQAAFSRNHAELELEQGEKRRDWQKEQVLTIEQQIQKAAEDTFQIINKLEETKYELNETKEQTRQLDKQVTKLPIEELQAEEVHWATRVAVTKTALKTAEERLSEYRNGNESNEEELRLLQNRLTTTSQEIKKLDREKDDLITRERDLNFSLEKLNVEIDPAEKQLEILEKKFAAHQADQLTGQQSFAVVDRSATQSQLEMLRNRDQLESLRKKIEDDFGLVAFEYATNISGPTPLPLKGMVEDLPIIEELSTDIEDALIRLKSQLRRLGAINPEAQIEYQDVLTRYEFLNEQIGDLNKADDDLRKVIDELDALMKEEFHKTFDAVAAQFKILFVRLFGGGSAHLVMTNEDHPAETGIDIEARLPGRREHGLSMLSGGERSLTAVALIFSLLKVSPTPFCVLDEVDAMLDEANVGRFCDLLQELSTKTQFIIVTHNRTTVQAADVIYGVTMGRDSSSQVISLKLDEISEELMNSG